MASKFSINHAILLNKQIFLLLHLLTIQSIHEKSKHLILFLSKNKSNTNKNIIAKECFKYPKNFHIRRIFKSVE